MCVLAGVPDLILIWHCVQYCRWIDNSGSGGNPALKLAHGYSYWSCQTSQTDVRTRYDSISSRFQLMRCGGKNAVPAQPATFTISDGGYTDNYRGWYDPRGVGICNQVSKTFAVAVLIFSGSLPILIMCIDSIVAGLTTQVQEAIQP